MASPYIEVIPLFFKNTLDNSLSIIAVNLKTLLKKILSKIIDLGGVQEAHEPMIVISKMYKSNSVLGSHTVKFCLWGVQFYGFDKGQCICHVSTTTVPSRGVLSPPNSFALPL